ncbi:hypothetical protein JNUCC1_00192 [Lentibacillus sp. JNUCC-1]|uniref:C39 family peptidase n=1 Tax=Lentibacillus sp. JNUCC-1 TaxID=2654513 RepID=UPI001320FBBB|nr:C39 family peptidase [Lentibacillus sp. JNUCC-1]MUV36390.1 hypothetical protein [Lentibacillus sp. JNUCC-1]
MLNKQVLIEGVPLDYQYPDLPTGCEATATSMLLRWAKIDADKFAVADQLIKGDKVHEIDGKWYGANPDETFVGDPYSDEGSYGVFQKPILRIIEHFLPECSLDLSGRDFTEVLSVLDKGTPVVAWTTLKQRETYYHKSWEDPLGQMIDWYNNEHAVTVVGYDQDFIIVHDPDTGKREFYDRDTFIHNWGSLGKRAVTLHVK